VLVGSSFFDLPFDVRRVEDADFFFFGDLLDPFALPCADLRRDPNGLGVAVDALEIVHVVRADLLKPGRVEPAGVLRRAEARLDHGAFALDAAALLREVAAGLPPRFGHALFRVVLLSTERGLALAVLLCECARGLVVERRRLVGVAAGTEFRLDGRLLLVDAVVFDLGLRLLGDFQFPIPSTSESSAWLAALTSSIDS
jgi:hypothetical protein